MAALRILITGASGFLGEHVVAAVQRAGHVACTTARRSGDVAVDIAGPGMVDAVLEALHPDVALHLAAVARLADCELDPQLARRVNVGVADRLAERLGARLLAISTDLVFDGRRAPYAATDPVAPLSVYGATKAEAEECVRSRGGRVVRLPLLFGPDAHGRGASASLRQAWSRGERTALFTNEYRTPLHAADAARTLVELAVDPGGPALVHLAGPDRVSRWELGQAFADVHHVHRELLQPAECQDPLRPRDVALVPTLPPRRSLAAMLADA
jgi:dTDP-4-dehydrorhamnose reductase